MRNLTLYATLCALMVLSPLTAAAQTEGYRNHLCDLSALPSLPKLIFVGENHKNPESIQIRESILKLGAQGVVPVATEIAPSGSGVGPYYPSARLQINFFLKAPKEKIHGIESEIAWSVLNSYLAAIDIITSSSGAELVEGIAKKILYLPGISILEFAALLRMQKNSPQQFRDFLAPIMEKELNSELYFKTVGESLEDKDTEFLAEFSREHHRNLIQIINENYTLYFGNRPIPTLNSRIDLLFFDFTFFMTTIRDRDFASNLTDVVCHYAGKEKQIFVLIGAGHGDGLEKNMMEISKNRLVISRFNTTADASASAIVRDILPQFQGSANTTPMPAKRNTKIAPIPHVRPAGL